MATDFGWPASWVIGFAMALSSTAFVLQLLAERHTLNRADGRAAFGVLLFQDIAVIPAIAIVALAGSGAAESTTIEPLWLGAAVLGIVAARFGLRPVLRFVAATGITELFAAASLALVVGAALAMNAVGLSMGLGAFIAGMLVADSEYRHQLETDVTPFKGLLLGLFFMAVGIATNIDLLVAEPLVIAPRAESLPSCC
ncbi:MAG: cation:proton antiporter [Gammaproteobacteria bacterium]